MAKETKIVAITQGQLVYIGTESNGLFGFSKGIEDFVVAGITDLLDNTFQRTKEKEKSINGKSKYPDLIKTFLESAEDFYLDRANTRESRRMAFNGSYSRARILERQFKKNL